MKQILTFLAVLTTVVSQAQFAGAVDTTFAANTTNPNSKAVGVEVVGNSVYYAHTAVTGQPVIRKYDFQGNEDESWYANQMATWGTQFATFVMEPERNSDGSFTGEFFVCGRNSSNFLVNQGVRFLNKVNADGTRDLNFVCPITSWISICSAIYHDWENGKLYYAYQSGTPSNYMQTIVCCDPNTGQILQTMTLPQSTGMVRKIAKIPGTNDLIAGGSLSFTHNGDQYTGVFKITSQWTIAPIDGITNSLTDMVVADILFVDDTDCSGIATGQLKAYIAGSGNLASGVSIRGIARYTLVNGAWNIDANFNAGCSGSISDIAYYNCHLIAVGNFASSMPSGPYAPVWSPKITAFTSDGLISEEFKMTNIGSGLGGADITPLQNNFGQGSGICVVVNPVDDGNNRWEIFVGGTFANLVQAAAPRNIIRPMNGVAKLFGFGNSIDSRFTYCLNYNSSETYSISTFDITNTSGCEKWELYQSSDASNWNLIRVDLQHDFTDTNLVNGTWYKLSRTVTECGNSCTTTFIFYNDPQNCQTQNNGMELRNFTITSSDNDALKQQEEESIGLSTYPNPASNVITITDKFGNAYRNVDLYNSIGSRVTSVNTNANVYQLDLSTIASGVYMLVVTTDIGVQRQQVIIE